MVAVGESVFILAGGQGSRLKPYTTVLPKPLIPVCDVPICEVLIHQLRDAGFRRIILGVNHHEGLVRSYFGDGRSMGVEIEYSRENAPLGTVAPLRLAADRLTDNFLVMNGDLLTDVDFRAMLKAHIAGGCVLTVGTYQRSLQIGDGVIDADDRGQITAFREKPAMNFWISMGVYAMRRSVLDWIPDNQPFGMDTLVLAMLAKGEPVNTFRHEGEWYDIGSPGDLERAAVAFAQRRHRFLPSKSAPLVGVA